MSEFLFLPPAMQDYFHLVEKIRADSKYLDSSIEEILRNLEDEGGKFEYEWEQELVESDYSVPLRLNIRCKGPVNSWTIALKLHCIRIDGIDWEAKNVDAQGQLIHGWHRHIYDEKSKSAENLKTSVEGFDNISDKRQFLLRAFKTMKILLKGVDDGPTELPFN